MPYRHYYANGRLEQRTFNLYAERFLLNLAKAVERVTLPNDLN